MRGEVQKRPRQSALDTVDSTIQIESKIPFKTTFDFENMILEQEVISRLGQMGPWIYKDY